MCELHIRCFRVSKKFTRQARWRPALNFQTPTVFCLPKQNSTQEQVCLGGQHAKVKSQCPNGNEAKLEIRPKVNYRNQIQWSSRACCSDAFGRSSTRLFFSLLPLSFRTLTVLLHSSCSELRKISIPSRWKPSQGRFRIMFLARFPFRASPLYGICVSPTRFPHPATGIIPFACGGGRS